MTWRALGLADIARHVIGCHSTQETWVQNAFKMSWLSWWGLGLADIARHVIKCQITQETRVQNAGR
jgi:hypothetical protein